MAPSLPRPLRSRPLQVIGIGPNLVSEIDPERARATLLLAEVGSA